MADVKESAIARDPRAFEWASLIHEPEFKFPTNESLLERKLRSVGPDDEERLANETEVRLTLLHWQRINHRLANLRPNHPWAIWPGAAFLDTRICI